MIFCDPEKSVGTAFAGSFKAVAIVVKKNFHEIYVFRVKRLLDSRTKSTIFHRMTKIRKMVCLDAATTYFALARRFCEMANTDHLSSM